MMLFESLIFNLLPAAVGIMAVVLVFESCWRKCPPDKLMIVSGAGKMRSVSGKGTFVIPLLQRVDTLSLGAVQVQLTTENDIPTQDAILIHACAVANFQIGQTPELIETASKNYLNLDSLKDSTGIDLPSLLNGLISNPDIDADSAENSVE